MLSFHLKHRLNLQEQLDCAETEEEYNNILNKVAPQVTRKWKPIAGPEQSSRIIERQKKRKELKTKFSY